MNKFKKIFKYAVIVAVALISEQCTAQFVTPIATPAWYHRFKVDGIFWLATSDTTDVSASSYPGAIIFQRTATDTGLYVSDGVKWQAVGTKINGSPFVKYTDTSNMFIPYTKKGSNISQFNNDLGYYKPSDTTFTLGTKYYINSRGYMLRTDLNDSLAQKALDVLFPLKLDSINKILFLDTSFMAIKQDTGTVILNQSSTKQNAVSRYIKSIVDTVTNQLFPSGQIDFRDGTNIFQYGSGILNLNSGSGTINIGNLAGYNSVSHPSNIRIGMFAGIASTNDTDNVIIGHAAAESQNGRDNTLIGFASGILANGDSLTFVGSNSGRSSEGTRLTGIGLNSGYLSNGNNSTYIGSYSGVNPNVINYPITSATGSHVITRGLDVTRWTCNNIKSLINDYLIVGDYYPGYIYYEDSLPGGNNVSYYGKIHVLDDSTIEIYGTSYNNDYGSGSFIITLNSINRDNQQVFGYLTVSDSSNQVALGNSNISQIKWGGNGNIRWNTSISPLGGQVPIWDSSSKQYEPGSIVTEPTILSLLPSRIYSIDSIESNVYFNNSYYIPWGKSDIQYDIDGDKGIQLTRNWRYTPLLADSGKTSLIFGVWYRNSLINNQQDSVFTTTLGSGNGITRNVIMFGNSTMSGGEITDDIKSDYGRYPFNLNFHGTNITPYSNYNEGHSGWRWSDFATVGRNFLQMSVYNITSPPVLNDTYSIGSTTMAVRGQNIVSGSGDIEFEIASGSTPPPSGKLIKISGAGDDTINYSSTMNVSGNPLWNTSCGCLDINNYLSKNGITMNNGDWFTFQLGLNDMYPYKDSTTLKTAISLDMIYIDSLINAIHHVNPLYRILIAIPNMPTSQDGFGYNYNNDQTYWRYLINLSTYINSILFKYDNSTYRDENVFVLGLNVAVDTKYNMEYSNEPVNQRNISTTENVSINGVHPASSGYGQMADAYYAIFKWFK